MEKGKIRVMLAKRQASLNVGVRIVAAIISLDLAGKEQFYLSPTSGLYFLAGRDFPDQSEHNAFDVRAVRSTWLFVLNSVSEAVSLIVFPLP